MDEYTILKKKRKKNAFASTALLISIAIALIAMVGAVLVLNKVDTKKMVAQDENSTVEELTNNSDATCTGFVKEVVFNDNLKTIKEAAISYFTNERLPQKVGESVTITLKQMKSDKLVRNVLDASGKSCSENDSYVEVTKAKDEYVMKVFLSCSNMEDYIIVHLGCYDYCDSNVCEKKEEIVKEYEYEYKKSISCEMSDWSNWSEWKTKREKTSNLKKEDIKVETQTKNVIDTKEATKSATTYNCNNYTGYTLVGDKCVKETVTKDVKDATPSKYSYNCDKYPGYSVVGTKCVKEEKKKEVINADKNPTTYYCPSGYSLNGTKCERMVSKTDKANGSYVCASGYTLSGTKCNKTITNTETANGSYTCPSGYTLSGTKCNKTNYSVSVVNGTPIYSTRKITVTYDCKKQECTTKTVFSCPVGKSCGNYPQTSCQYVNSKCTRNENQQYISGYKCPDGYKYVVPTKENPKEGTCSKTITTTDTKDATFTCPSGYTVSGTSCKKTTSTVDTKNATFTCPSGYTVSGTSCKKTTSTVDTKNATFTCPSGYTVNGTSCTKSYQEKETINATANPVTYSCKQGYTLNGTNCEKTVTTKDTKDATKVAGGYVCSDGYTLSGKTCTKQIKYTDTKKADTNKVTYTCPSGYALSGTKCTKNVTQKVKTTYYRYATRTCDGGSTSYEWSTSNNDSILKADGYKLTGKKRELIIK